MFALKGRAKSKPGVVLAISPEHVFMLAQTSDKIRQLYERCYGEYQELDETKSVLLGCILPWHPRALSAYVKEDCWPMMSDRKPFVRTSCFVVRYGIPLGSYCSQSVGPARQVDFCLIGKSVKARQSWRACRASVQRSSTVSTSSSKLMRM